MRKLYDRLPILPTILTNSPFFLFLLLIGTVVAFFLWGYAGEWFNRYEDRPGQVVDPYVHFKLFSTLLLYLVCFFYLLLSERIKFHVLVKLSFLPITLIFSLLSLLVYAAAYERSV
jgi:hypothetical protein